MGNEIISIGNTADISELRKKARLQKWQQELEAQQCSGVSIREWCQSHNISPSTFYKRLKVLRSYFCNELNEHHNQAGDTQAVIPVGVLESSNGHNGIKITSSGIDVSISGDISAENLRAIIQSLKPC